MISTYDGKLLFTATGKELADLIEKTRTVHSIWNTEGASIIREADADWQRYIDNRIKPAQLLDPLPEALQIWQSVPWYKRFFVSKPTRESHPRHPVAARYQPERRTFAVREFNIELDLLLGELKTLDVGKATLVRKGELNSFQFLPHRILNVNEYLPFKDLMLALGLNLK